VKLLLDTNIIVWLALASDRLDAGLTALLSTERDVTVSVVSRWELGVKAKLGRFAHLTAIDTALDIWAFPTLPVALNHARLAADLPLLHRDPFDRILVAQAMIEGMTLVTSDATLAAYNVPVLMA
jgi:PIN domain nuclease of toxin-antitoxin system